MLLKLNEPEFMQLLRSAARPVSRCQACHSVLLPRYLSTVVEPNIAPSSSKIKLNFSNVYFSSAKSPRSIAQRHERLKRVKLAPQETALSNASSEDLVKAGWSAVPLNYSAKEYLKIYMGLSKFRLSALIVLSTMAGYAICPADPSSAAAATEAFMSSFGGPLPLELSSNVFGSAASSLSNNLSLPVLLSTATGTLLCCAAANTLNQMSEVPYDAQMARTRNRVLVRRTVTPLHAFNFAAVTSFAGVSTLYAFVNPLTAFLGASNIFLYSFVYTPLKRISIVNTWIGAVVGALPPLMGWAACTNSLNIFTQPGAWALAALLFAWQFPHFNSLAHTLRHDYAKAGFYMIPVTNPDMNARVALRYSLAFFPICAAFPLLGIASPWFTILSCVPNGFIAWASYRFWRGKDRGKDARLLFFASLVHLPVVLVMLMVMKEDVWQRMQDRWDALFTPKGKEVEN